jgi:hypothetical protein
MGRIASGLVASAFLITVGKPALGFDLQDAWWDLPKTESAVVAFVKDDPDFTVRFVTLSSGGVLLDATWWPGSSPFLKQDRLEPGGHPFKAGSEALPAMRDPASMWFVALELDGKPVTVSSIAAGLAPQELRERFEEGESGAPDFRSRMSYFEVPETDLKLVVQPFPSVK